MDRPGCRRPAALDRPVTPVPFVSGRLYAYEAPLISCSPRAPDVSSRPFISRLLLHLFSLFSVKLLGQCAMHLCSHAETAVVQRKAFSNHDIILKLLVQLQELQCLIILQTRDHFCWFMHLGGSRSYFRGRWRRNALGLPQSSMSPSVLRRILSYEDCDGTSSQRSSASGSPQANACSVNNP
jgi:hypothetical protein